MTLTTQNSVTIQGLTKKITQALERIREQYNIHGTGMYVGHSGGKDSCVITHLVHQIFPAVHVIHNSKLEPGKTHTLTLYFLYELSTKFPIMFLGQERMGDYLKKNGLTCQVDGTRRDECGRTLKSDDVIIKGQSVNRADMPGYVEEGIFGQSALYPIFDWTEDEVFAYINLKGIPISKEYDEEIATRAKA